MEGLLCKEEMKQLGLLACKGGTLRDDIYKHSVDKTSRKIREGNGGEESIK